MSEPVAVNELLRRYAHLPQMLDRAFPLRNGHSDGAVALSCIALLAQGITGFDAVEAMRRDPGLAHAPGSAGVAVGTDRAAADRTAREGLAGAAVSGKSAVAVAGGLA